MSRPPKPISVINLEKKSHRTKAEKAKREKEEAGLMSGVSIKERKEVKDNKIADKEFKRIIKLFRNMNKNDALYEAVLNRFCMLQAECYDLEERREEFHGLLKDIRSTFKEITEDIDIEDKANLLIELTRELAKITNSMNNIDKLIQTKRKMLLDIEKENILTVASALRSIPKTPEEEEEDPMAKMLKARMRG